MPLPLVMMSGMTLYCSPTRPVRPAPTSTVDDEQTPPVTDLPDPPEIVGPRTEPGRTAADRLGDERRNLAGADL
jgi:hypothetical protein